MKKLITALALLLSTVFISKAEAPLWLRNSAISPDGKTIAFTYKGDIFTVPSAGGQAKAITTNPAYDTKPIWSPDGKKIAFASDREGSTDVYIVSAEGGEPVRLTTHSGSETPLAFLDNGTILFKAYLYPGVEVDNFPTGVFWQVYKVSTTPGARPVLYSNIPLEDLSIRGGKILYHDSKSFENEWRKHHVSAFARDIWMLENGKYTQLTTFRGEDRTPIWADDNSYFYLSEQDGSFNVYKRTLNGEDTQLTKHKENPVRFLTKSNDGLLCYSYDGEIYTLREGGKPSKVSITIVADKLERDVVTTYLSMGAYNLAVSPSGKEVAFMVNGDVYVTSVEYATTKRITNTPEQERNLEFSPDGRSLLYSSERNGVWGVYQTSLVKEKEKMFTYATDLKEELLTDSKLVSFQAKYSPDGKSIAYLEDRTIIKVMDLKSKKAKTVLEGKYNYSYGDGDVHFDWSPNSKYLLCSYIGIGGWNSKDMALVDVESGELTNLTQSGYTDAGGQWVLDGKAMMWQSDRAGMRSHGSWGATYDAYIMFFDAEAYDTFRLTKEEASLIEKDPKDTTKKELVLDLKSHEDRVLRLTRHSSNLYDAYLSKDGNKLYYLTSFEGQPDLWVQDFKEGTTKILVKGAGYGSLVPDKDGKNLFMASMGMIKKIDVASGQIKPVSFRAQFDVEPAATRAYMFDHTWRILKDKFYVTNMHGVDWAKYYKVYSKFLPHINNGADFGDLLSEMLGELNVSHTGGRFRSYGSVLSTAELGAFFDPAYTGDGLKIVEIPIGSPLERASVDIKVGDIIQKIDGVTIKAGMDYYPLLAGKVGQQIELTVVSGKDEPRSELIKPISLGLFNELRYKRWVDQRREKVKELSNDRIGYVHVRGMDSPSFREVYSELLGRYRNHEAVVVDTRYNGGGWLHDDLVTLLSGKEYQRFTPRGVYIGSDPYNKWTKPSIVIQSEGNYSNAHGFPWLYKELGVGKLVGTPVPGTMTAVWWESLIDGQTVIGIPQVACQDMRGNLLENQELMPDIEVYNTPETVLKGEDTQLKVAVEELLKEIGKNKK